MFLKVGKLDIHLFNGRVTENEGLRRKVDFFIASKIERETTLSDFEVKYLMGY